MEASISEKNIIKVERGKNDEVKHVESKSLNIDEQTIIRTDDQKTCHGSDAPVNQEKISKIREKVEVFCTEIAIEYPQSEKICPGFSESNFELIKKDDEKTESVTVKRKSELDFPDKVINKDNNMDFDSKMDNVGYIYTGVHADKNAEHKPPPAQKIYACPECSFTCSQRGHLNVHRRTHSGEKPFHCLECGFRFLRKGALNNHMATHTGLKPFSCSECEYACSRKGDLKLHSRIHTGEKPFSCTECEYKCSQKGTIKNHILTHTGEKPFSCSKCEYICSEKGSLRRHSRMHAKKLV